MPSDAPARPYVLVIDDDEELRATIQDVLEDQGFAVATAANGREALDMLLRDDSQPALILLDLTMPEMDGWAFRKEQQKVPRLAQIPVVLFSGNVDAQSARSLNVAATMTKPLRLEGLVTLVDRILRPATGRKHEHPRRRRRPRSFEAIARRGPQGCGARRSPPRPPTDPAARWLTSPRRPSTPFSATFNCRASTGSPCCERFARRRRSPTSSSRPPTPTSAMRSGALPDARAPRTT